MHMLIALVAMRKVSFQGQVPTVDQIIEMANWVGDGRVEGEVGNQYVKEGGQGVAARNSPLLGGAARKNKTFLLRSNPFP